MNNRAMLIPTIFTIPALILLLALGTWQLYRLQWKLDIIHKVEAHMALPPIALPASLPDPLSWHYRKVTVEGTFMHDKEMLLYAGARQYKGDSGYRLFTPLKRSDGSIVIIDRGWVPEQKRLQQNRTETLVAGVQHVKGTVMLGEKKKFFVPEPDQGLWFWINLPAMYKTAGAEPLDFYVMQAPSSDPEHLPFGTEVTKHSIRNDHLSYAIIWYSAAVTLIVIYVLYYRGIAQKRRSS